MPKLVLSDTKDQDYDTIIYCPIELGISSLVFNLSYVSKADLSELYSGSVAFLYPNLFVGFKSVDLRKPSVRLSCYCSYIGSYREIFWKIMMIKS